MKTGIVALALIFGFGFAAQAQDTTGNQYFECVQVQPDDIQSFDTEQQSDIQLGAGEDTSMLSEPSARGEAQLGTQDTTLNQYNEFEFEEECPAGDAKQKMDQEQQFEFEQETVAPESDMSIEKEVEGEIESDYQLEDADIQPSDQNEASDTEFYIEEGTSMNQDLEFSESNKVADLTVYTEVEERESTLENIVEAPFKVAKTIVSESAEGVGHIIGAPFKGVAKLFGHDDNRNVKVSNDIKVEGEEILVEETTPMP